MNAFNFFSKRDIITLAGVVASVIIPKLVVPEYYIQEEPVKDFDEDVNVGPQPEDEVNPTTEEPTK